MSVVARVRKQLGYSQKELARKLDVSIDSVKSWEVGRRRPQDVHIQMLLVFNEDPKLTLALKKLRPIYEIVLKVKDYLDQQMGEQNSPVRFVFHGKSGCGKTSVVGELDEILPSGEGVAENTDLYRTENFCKALEIFNDEGLEYENSKHIVFNVISDDLAASLESNGVKVFHFD